MALLKYSSIVGSASGRLGGIVFSSRKGAPSIQRAPLRTRSHTDQQTDAQQLLSIVQTSWASLSYLHQMNWNNTGRNMLRVNRLGVSSPYNGYQLYLHVNLTRLSAGLALLTAAPPNRQVLQIIPSYVAFYTGSNEYYLGFITPSAYPSGYVYIQGARSMSLTGIGPRYWHSVATYYMAGTGSLEIYAQWEPTVGTLAPGEWFGLRVTWLGDNAFPSSPLAFPRLAGY